MSLLTKKVGFRRSRRVNVIVFSESAFEQMSEVNCYSGRLCIWSWTTATSTLFLQQTKRNCHVAAPMTVCCFVVTPPPISEWSIVMSVSACVCVCVCLIAIRTTRPIFAIPLCMLLMAVARSSSGGVVIHYVLPVLRMTSCLLISQGCSTSLSS